ncbi:response regulator transcription factor [Leucothrix pacifica]|uniref:DNA-binding response regulator n=1 Tax=Leucothrix pacifica TaxID=1247513 RepID=A0A317CPZ1_9GAMM|nr:response regulator transcription factor [Leucothrix pacifica]PWR00639.1 DNA-binding response regulator [Leucothrix pacifica]
MTNKHHTIYIVDDEVAICELLENEFQLHGYTTRSFQTGKEAQQAIDSLIPDVCIIDLGLPDMNGLTIVRDLMDTCETGVIILSGRNSLPDKVLGLELGADDYVSKPFQPRELVARANSIVRRMGRYSENAQSAQQNTPKQAHFDGWSFDVPTLSLHNTDGRTEKLSAAEAELLLSFLHSPQQILSRDQLMKQQMDAFDRCVDVRMSRIRKKIERDPKDPALIKTVYGVGYMFASSVEWDSH